MSSASRKLGLSTEADTGLPFPAAALHGRNWPMKSSSSHCEEQDASTGNKRSWGAGAESPVSVIGHNMMQGSQPSSGSASMEHPVFTCTSLPPPSSSTSHFHHLPLQYQDSLSTEPLNSTQSPDSLSERVQQAFRKSHELQPHVVKMWSTSATNKRMDWLNLQEDLPLIRAADDKLSNVYQYSRQSHTFGVAGRSTDVTQAASSSEEDRLSIYSSTRDQQEDDDSVIDFFPSGDSIPNTVNMHASRRASTINRVVLQQQQQQQESWRGSTKRRSSCVKSAGGGHQQHTPHIVMDENEGRVSTSYKWDDAERWLTSPTAPARPAPPPQLHQRPFSSIDLHGRTKAAPLIQVQARKPLSDPTFTQDKHVPVSGDSHGFLREAGTQVTKDGKRDIATQSTPAEWSRCDSPEEESAILSNTPQKPSAGGAQEPFIASPDKAAAAQKTSPPRHNTPARRSVSCSKGRENPNPLPGDAHNFNTSGKLNLLELESCHLDKLKLARDLPIGTSSTWLLYADEESQPESKELFVERKSPPQQMKVNMLEARVSAWEDVERAKHLAKFKREEAKIEAWESLQHAEADAELRKLEVKLEKMRFEGREKITGKLRAAQRRAQEMRSVAEAQKAEQLTRVAMRANQIRKSGHLPSSTFNVMCSLTTKIKPPSNLSFS